MAIINTKERTLGPFLLLPIWWLQNIQDDRDPIFIVVPDDPLIGIGSIGQYHPIPLHRALGGFMVWDDDLMSRL